MKIAFGVLVFLMLLMGACGKRAPKEITINVRVYPSNLYQADVIDEQDYDLSEEEV